MNMPLFTGCATALVTPFLPNGQLDEPALRRLLFMQLEAKIDALVLLGTFMYSLVRSREMDKEKRMLREKAKEDFVRETAETSTDSKEYEEKPLINKNDE